MANNNIFPSFLDTSSNTNTSGAGPRSAPSPTGQQQQQPGNNGNGAGLNGLPMLAGQQMDVNFLYQRVVELSEVLRGNREKTQAIITGAEELGVRAFPTQFPRVQWPQASLIHQYIYLGSG